MFNSIYSDQLSQYYGLRRETLSESAEKHELCYLRRFDSYVGYTGALKAPVRCFGNHLSGQRKSQFRTDNECGGAAILKDRTSRMVSLIGC